MKWRATCTIDHSRQILILQQNDFKPKMDPHRLENENKNSGLLAYTANALANSYTNFFVQHCCLISLLLHKLL